MAMGSTAAMSSAEVGGELHQAEPGAIRALAKELGIDGKHRTGGRALAEALELLIR